MPPKAMRSRRWYRPSCCARCTPGPILGRAALKVEASRANPLRMKSLAGVSVVLLAALLGCSRSSEARAESPEPTVAAPPPKVAGPHAEGQGFVVDVKPADAKAGAAAVTKVVLHPTA